MGKLSNLKHNYFVRNIELNGGKRKKWCFVCLLAVNLHGGGSTTLSLARPGGSTALFYCRPVGVGEAGEASASQLIK